MRPANDLQPVPPATLFYLLQRDVRDVDKRVFYVRRYLTLCDTHAPLFLESELSATFGHTPLPSQSTAKLSPISSLQVIFILTLPSWTHKNLVPGTFPCRGTLI